jgi:NADH:ubiquinone oxidoreductase subunit 5 (subunit L)/multisubunit Na+/H+ antiporter MnhA subunit
VITLLATFVGFIYMARFIQTIFLGPRKTGNENVAEAPMALLIPQYLLIAGILVMSFFPKLLIEPISEAIDPQFASTLVWQGMSLEMIYGYWNPMPVMAFSIAVAAILFGSFWLLRRTGWLASPNAGTGNSSAGYYDFCKRAFTILTPPWASAFWAGLAGAMSALAGRTRELYTGNGRTYTLYILYYFLALYVAGGGLRHLWPRS